jgi:hypothetical protein
VEDKKELHELHGLRGTAVSRSSCAARRA